MWNRFSFKQKNFRLLFTVAIAVMMLVVPGCRGDGTVKISGKVTVDGEVVETGSIAFAPLDGKTSVEGAEIINGEYKAKVPPGDKIVRIRGMKLQPTEVYDVVSKTTHVSSTAIRITDVKYEAEKSPLQATITKNGEVHDFDLPSMNQEKK